MNRLEVANLKKRKMRDCPEFWDRSKSSDYVVEAMARHHMLVVTHDMVNIERRKEGCSFELRGGHKRPKREYFKAPAWKHRRPQFSKLQIGTMRIMNKWKRPEGMDAHLNSLPKREHVLCSELG